MEGRVVAMLSTLVASALVYGFMTQPAESTSEVLLAATATLNQPAITQAVNFRPSNFPEASHIRRVTRLHGQTAGAYIQPDAQLSQADFTQQFIRWAAGTIAISFLAYLGGRYNRVAMAALTGSKRMSSSLHFSLDENVQVSAPEPATAPEPKPAAAPENPAQKRGTPPAPKVEINNAAYFDIRVGQIVEVGIHPNAEGLYLEKIDVGEAEPRQIISGLVQHVPIDQMQGAKVLVMCNLKPAKLRDLMSYGMVMCASQTEGESRIVQLVQIPEGAKPGDQVTFPGLEGSPVAEMPKKRVEKLMPDFCTNEEGVCCWKDVPLTLESGVVKANLKNARLS